jgi:RNA polymerase sigma factor (sigma-70 family)
MTYSGQTTIQKFRNQDEDFMKEVYLTCKPKFMGFIQKEYQLKVEDCEDLYQESYCLLYKKIVSKNITELTASLDTLLIGFGRNLARNFQRKRKEDQMEVLPDRAETENPHRLYEKKEQTWRLEGLLDLVGEKCKEVLIKFYYLEFSMKEIAEEMGYASDKMAKKKKYECLKKIKKEVGTIQWN